MRIKLDEVIGRIRRIKDCDGYDNGDILDWINEIEGRVISDVIKTYEKQVISLTKDVLIYNLLSGYNSYDVVDISINKVPVTKTNIRDLYNAYFTDDSTLVFQAGKDAEVIIIYQKKHVPYSLSAISSTYLLIEHPHSKIYLEYVSAQVDLYNKEYKAYNNSITVFNNSFSEFERWYKQRNPITNSRVTNLW